MLATKKSIHITYVNDIPIEVPYNLPDVHVFNVNAYAGGNSDILYVQCRFNKIYKWTISYYPSGGAAIDYVIDTPFLELFRTKTYTEIEHLLKQFS